MKKSISLITICIILVIALAGCGTVSTPTKSNTQQSNTPTQNQTTTSNDTQSQSTTLPASNTTEETPNVQGRIETPSGWVWNPNPLTKNTKGLAEPSLTTPFSLYLSPNNTKQLQTSSAEKILTLPLKENQFYVYLGDYYYSDNWVVYSLSLIDPGMAQPYSNQLRAINLDNKKDILITSFHDAGGDSFGVASNTNLIIFSQKTPGPGVTYLKQVYIYDLSNGQKEPVDRKDLKVISGKNAVEYSKDGQTLTFQLQLRSVTVPFE